MNGPWSLWATTSRYLSLTPCISVDVSGDHAVKGRRSTPVMSEVNLTPHRQQPDSAQGASAWMSAGHARSKDNGNSSKAFGTQHQNGLSRVWFLLPQAMLGFDVTAQTPHGEKRVHLVAINESVALSLAKRAFGDHPLSIRTCTGPTRRQRDSIPIED